MPSIQELFALDGRVAIVTGGSRGLGEEMAEGLAEAGAALMICARREQWLTPTLERFAARGFRVEGLVADVSNPADVQAVVDKTMAAYGRIDILVNNAGITWGARAGGHAARQVAEGDRRQPHRGVPVRAGGWSRDAEAGIWAHHQHRVHRRPARRRCTGRTTRRTPPPRPGSWG